MFLGKLSCKIWEALNLKEKLNNENKNKLAKNTFVGSLPCWAAILCQTVLTCKKGLNCCEG